MEKEISGNNAEQFEDFEIEDLEFDSEDFVVYSSLAAKAGM